MAISTKVRVRRIAIAVLVVALFVLAFWYFLADAVSIDNESGQAIVGGSIQVAGHTYQVSRVRAGSSTSFHFWPKDQSDFIVTLRLANGKVVRSSTGLSSARMFGNRMRAVIKRGGVVQFRLGGL